MAAAQYSVSDLRRANRNRVYRYLYETTEPQTTLDIAKALSMSLPTVNQNLNELLAMGLIDNSQIASSSGGRKPRIISIVPSARYAIGVEISPHHLRMVAIDLGVNELGYQTVKRQFTVSDEYSQSLVRDIAAFVKDLGLDPDKILGVGITLPGIVDTERKLLEGSPTLNERQLDLGFLTHHISFPTRICNDADAGGFAEWWNQAGLMNMAYLSVGRGIGGALLINGAPYEGMCRRSGEFGHMYIHPGGKICSCGKRGCLEAYCSTAVLSDDLGITLDGFFQSLDRGDQDKAEIWECYLKDMATGIINILSALDCDIIIGGSLSQYLEGHMDELREHIRRMVPLADGSDRLHLCRYHGKSNSIGAALQFVDAFLSNI